MVIFEAEIERFDKMGEKTGWFYIPVDSDLSEQINPGCRKIYRVSGRIDAVEITGMALMPMGSGNFILALPASLRKQLRKGAGDRIQVSLAVDHQYQVPMPELLEDCLSEEPVLRERFFALSNAHQHYFMKWIDSAKTAETIARRVALTLKAMELGQSYSEMIRAARSDK